MRKRRGFSVQSAQIFLSAFFCNKSNADLFDSRIKLASIYTGSI